MKKYQWVNTLFRYTDTKPDTNTTETLRFPGFLLHTGERVQI